MQLSCKSEYALLALFELAQHHSDNEPLQIKQIATSQGIPERYLEQLLAVLRRQGFVKSVRGAKGGYLLSREPWQINLYDVIQSIDGQESGQTIMTVEGNIVQAVWQKACDAAIAMLQAQTLQDLCDERQRRQQTAVMYYI